MSDATAVPRPSTGASGFWLTWLAAVTVGVIAFGLLLVVAPGVGRQGFSLLVWFIPDTTFSIASGFWQNAILNLVFAILFLIPLTALYRQTHERGVSPGGD
jgi:uncharacterized membrane protein YhaH (DUF805 family)